MFTTVCVSRQTAKERGLKRFMTGEPCLKGHLCARWVTDGRCYECAKEKVRNDGKKNPRMEYRREYQQRPEVKARNAELLREKRKRHPDVVREYDRKKYEKIMNTPELLLKERTRQLAKQKKAYQADPEKFKQKRKDAYWSNEEIRNRSINYCKEWKRKNPDKCQLLNLKHNPIRRASKINRTPKWLTEEDRRTMLEIYKTAKMLGGHVDHIIPLQGKLVSGLHVPTNLQILTPEANHAKRNNYEVE